MRTEDLCRLSSPAARKVRLAAVRIAPPHAQRVLDAACGTGLLFRETNIYPGAARICLDSSADRLRHVAPGCIAIHGDLFAPPPLPGPFDVIFLLNTLYNLGDTGTAVRALQSLSKHLAQRGVIIADIRNAAHPILRLRYALYRLLGRFAPTAHSLRQVTSTAAERGLRVLRIVPVGRPLPFAYLLVLSPAEDKP